MIVDASAALAILMAETDADRFAQVLARAGRRAMSAVNWLEAAMAVDRRGGPAAQHEFEGFFARARIEIVPVTADLVALARRAFNDWGKNKHPAWLNMGDCIAYALAKQRGEPLLCKGNDFVRTDIELVLKD